MIRHLDIQSVQEHDWWWNNSVSPVPSNIHTFIVKIASRCNLDCVYCYMYKYSDQRWRLQPKFMTEETIHKLAQRINEYAIQNGLQKVYIVLHGGEPLLVGSQNLQSIYRIIRAEISNEIDVFFYIQTNGILLNQEFIDLFKETGTSVGLSVDGPPMPASDLRILHSGESSAFLVEAALDRLIVEAKEVFSGVLSVINLENNPVENFEYFKGKQVRSINYLFPDANHDNLPPGVSSAEFAVKYTDWLEPIFLSWYNSNDDSQPDITLFTSIIRLLLGETTLIDSIGSETNNLVVVETNGDIEGLDSLKTTYNGASYTGLNIFDNTFSDAAVSPCLLAGNAGIKGLCNDCQTCQIVEVCKGGYQPNRYSKKNGFLNKSVYCSALKKLIHIIAKRMAEDFINSSVPLPELIKKVLSESNYRSA